MQATYNHYYDTLQMTVASSITTLQTITRQGVTHLDRFISQIYNLLTCSEAIRTYRTLGHLLVLVYLFTLYGLTVIRETWILDIQPQIDAFIQSCEQPYTPVIEVQPEPVEEFIQPSEQFQPVTIELQQTEEIEAIASLNPQPSNIELQQIEEIEAIASLNPQLSNTELIEQTDADLIRWAKQHKVLLPEELRLKISKWSYKKKLSIECRTVIMDSQRNGVESINDQ